MINCGGGGGGDDDTSGDLSFLGVSDAKNLYIKPGMQSSAVSAVDKFKNSGNSGNKLMKVTEAGTITEVSLLDSNHSKNVGTLNPVYLQDINNNFFIIVFDGSDLIPYLCRKTDGAVFKMPNLMSLYSSHFYNDKLFKKDNNNIYYMSADGIIRVSLDDMTGTYVSPSTDNVVEFEVDSSGNIAYFAGTTHRLKTIYGSLSNFPSDARFWKSTDGNLYIQIYDGGHLIKKVSVSGEGVVTYDLYGGDMGTNIITADSYQVDLGNYTYIIHKGTGTIWEVYNTLSTPRTVSLVGLTISSITGVIATDNYYYIAGTDSSYNSFLAKITPGTDDYVKLISNGYEIYTMTADESDGVTFNALRLSDGKKIIGKIPINGGAITVLDEESDTRVIYLERIR